MTQAPPPASPLLGVDYFPEHWPRERWERDAQLMVEAGLTVVRIAEFTWSKIQPRPECWDWAWLDDAVELLADAGLQVILCTPSACPPPWMIEADPSISPVLQNGKPLGLGHRRHYSPHHQGYQEASRDMAERMAKRYGQHPAVIAFQIDNELCGNTEDYGPLAQAAFQDWLEQRHGDLETLDQRLGLIFWGHQFNSWSQIPVPCDHSFHPGLQLEYKRFCSEAWVRFCAVQADAMRPHIGERLLTTNCYLHRWGTHIDWSDLVSQGGLDRFSFDNYSSSDHENAFYNDLGRALSPGHWILEQQCGLPQGQNLWPDDPERLRRALLRSVERGAELLTFFRWRQGLFGQEQDHGAILDHHGRPGPTFRQVQEVAAEIAHGEVKQLPPARVGAVFSWEDSWALASSPEAMDHVAISIERVSQAAHLAEEPLNWVLRPEQLQGLELIVVAGKVIRDEAWEEALVAAAEAGACIVSLPLFGAKDRWNAYLPDYQSEIIRKAQGALLERRINLRGEHQLHSQEGMKLGLRAEAWELDADGEVLDRFAGGPLQDQPALFRHAVGRGSWVTLAGYPDPQAFARLLTQLCQ